VIDNGHTPSKHYITPDLDTLRNSNQAVAKKCPVTDRQTCARPLKGDLVSNKAIFADRKTTARRALDAPGIDIRTGAHGELFKTARRPCRRNSDDRLPQQTF